MTTTSWKAGDRFRMSGSRHWSGPDSKEGWDTYVIECRVQSVNGKIVDWDLEGVVECHKTMPEPVKIEMLVPNRGGFNSDFVEDLKIEKLEGERPRYALWAEEFGPDFPVPCQVLKLLAQGKLQDTSWHNDVCPSFETNNGHYRLWIDYEDPDSREMQGARFMVCINVEWAEESDQAQDTTYYSGDEIEAALAELARLEAAL